MHISRLYPPAFLLQLYPLRTMKVSAGGGLRGPSGQASFVRHCEQIGVWMSPSLDSLSSAPFDTKQQLLLTEPLLDANP